MRTIQLHPPQKRKDHYLSKISDEHKKKVCVTLRGASWIHLRPVEGDGHVLRIFVPGNGDGVRALGDLDTQVVTQVLAHKDTWFPGRLSEDQVRTYFRPSFQAGSSSSMGAYVSPWKEPLVFWDGRAVESIYRLPDVVPKDAHVRVELEPIGVCFFPQKFGVRWLLRKVWIDTGDAPQDVAHVAEEDRAAIEEAWHTELDELRVLLDDDKRELAAKMERLDALYVEWEAALSAAREAEDARAWNEGLEALARSIAKYRSGAVTAPK
jgi:hypothetical protein